MGMIYGESLIPTIVLLALFWLEIVSFPLCFLLFFGFPTGVQGFVITRSYGKGSSQGAKLLGRVS